MEHQDLLESDVPLGSAVELDIKGTVTRIARLQLWEFLSTCTFSLRALVGESLRLLVTVEIVAYLGHNSSRLFLLAS